MNPDMYFTMFLCIMLGGNTICNAMVLPFASLITESSEDVWEVANSLPKSRQKLF